MVNIEQTGEFVWNMATWGPRVAASPVQFEYRHLQTVRLPGNGAVGSVDVVFGRVVAIHIEDRHLRSDGRLDIEAIRPLARMGYHDYTTVDKVFTMTPAGSPVRLAGLEGSPEKMSEALQQIRKPGA